MKYIIEIRTENAAFDDGKTPEIARILKAHAEVIEEWGLEAATTTLRDINGNSVGGARFVKEKGE